MLNERFIVAEPWPAVDDEVSIRIIKTKEQKTLVVDRFIQIIENLQPYTGDPSIVGNNLLPDPVMGGEDISPNEKMVKFIAKSDENIEMAKDDMKRDSIIK